MFDSNQLFGDLGGADAPPDLEELRRRALLTGSTGLAGGPSDQVAPGPVSPGVTPLPPFSPTPTRSSFDQVAAGITAGQTGAAAGQPAAPASAQPFTFTGTPTAEQLNQYFTSRGVGTQETPYWLSKWSELEARGRELGDPGYAMRRLAQAEAFGGSPYDIGRHQEGPPSGIGGLGGGGDATGGGQTSGGGGTDSQVGQALRDQLLRLMASGEAPINENDLQIRQPFEAARVAAERELEQAQQANAERLYASGGLHSGELGQLGQQGRERVAVGLGQTKAGLIGHEIDARRQQLSHALQVANALGARQEAVKLQRELAQMEQQYRYAQLGQQQSQFNDQYGLQRQQYIDAMNRMALLAGMG